jgi:hypothetical protein
MWHTSKGNRTLTGLEARVFAEGLLGFVDEACTWDIDDHRADIKAYDRLAPGQKLSVLRTIAEGLLCAQVEPVTLTGALEGTITAIFSFIEAQVIAELDMQDIGSAWRQMVRDARQECEDELDISMDNSSRADWEFQIEGLSDRILWDSDCATGELLMDLPPEESEAFRMLMGIPDAYMQTIPDDLSDEEVQSALKEIRRICLPLTDQSGGDNDTSFNLGGEA